MYLLALSWLLCVKHVFRFIHFSDIGASETSASKRMRSKAAGDKAVKEALPHATIIKPAPIVGELGLRTSHICIVRFE